MKIILAVAAAILLTAPAYALQDHTIAVDGSATLSIPPDYATISLGVVSQAKIVADALGENSAKMHRVIEALKAIGIPQKDIATSDFSIQPRYEKAPPGQEYDSDDMRPIAGYAVRNNVRVTIDDLGKIAKVIDVSVDAGANASNQVSFALRDPSQLLDKIRIAVVEAAHHKAEVFAAAAHMKLGRVLSIADSRTGMGGGSADYQTVPIAVSAYSGADPRQPTPVLFSDINISDSVTVVYATD
ncbi:MAG TPA: SIMPL domain-containing protein [Rhizomicrobium sp.]